MVKTTYLEMLARTVQVVPPPRDGLAVVRARKPTVAYYRFLYDAVGRDYDWTSRKKLSDAELAALLNDPRLEVHVLMADGVSAGFAKLDRRTEGEVELVQFGLLPAFIGQGLGRYFLQWAIDKAWSYRPTRFWLHTDTKGPPGRLPELLNDPRRIGVSATGTSPAVGGDAYCSQARRRACPLTVAGPASAPVECAGSY